jgi:TetR/AcrR family transcriptional repressor of nem operon
MARSSQQEAEANRARMVTEAARVFRERGVDRTGIADVMGSIGLTHGAFYSHFASKDALAAQACEHAFTRATDTWLARLDHGQEPAGQILTDVIERYLSTAHRDEPGTGCPGAALATDAARDHPDGPLRGAFLAGIRGMVAALARLMPASLSATRRRERALVTVATMLGAITIARATSGDAFSEEMLAAVRKTLVGGRQG